MDLGDLPADASWRHVGVRTGYEVLFVDRVGDGVRLRGSTAAREGDASWYVGFEVEVDARWQTRRVRAVNATAAGNGEVVLERDPRGRWTVDGVPRPELDGCADVDFESSAVTNTLPVHRLPFTVGETVAASAAFVRADDLSVERLEQRYTLLKMDDDGPVFHYESPTFDFECELRFDPSGLVRTYPGIAVRDY
ncbi:putative glycolipid-binding domain-containing protein [Kribbella sp. NPDC026611]|uniref:putative glycolipid-binding domain-containing protein n=1 Tax=Kribbella sp. NPDC026611 TaxID=3154911 RepID=UPI00340CA85D